MLENDVVILYFKQVLLISWTSNGLGRTPEQFHTFRSRRPPFCTTYTHSLHIKSHFIEIAIRVIRNTRIRSKKTPY